MYIIINSVIVAICIIFLSLIVFLGRSNISRNNYDFATTSNKVYKILGYLFAFSGISVEIIGLLVSIFDKNNPICFVPVGMGAFFFILSILVLMDQFFDYEAIEGNEVVIHRFYMKAKHIPIKSISDHSVNNYNKCLFYKHDGSFAFAINPHTGGLEKFISLLSSRKKLLNSEMYEEEQKEHEAKLELIGNDYRDSYQKRRIIFVLSMMLFDIIVILICVVISNYIDSKKMTVFLIISTVLASIIIFAIIFSALNKMKEELKLSNKILGERYAPKSNLVVGHAKTRIRKTIIIGSAFFLFFILFGLLLFLLISIDKLVLESELIPKTYHLEYVEKRKGEIALGFMESDTEYRVSSYSSKYFDVSFLEVAKKNDEITIMIDNSEDHKLNNKYISKHYQNTLYSVIYNGHEYYTYNDYYLGYKDNVKLGNVISYISFAIGGCSIIISLGFVFYLNLNTKKEYIEL